MSVYTHTWEAGFQILHHCSLGNNWTGTQCNSQILRVLDSNVVLVKDGHWPKQSRFLFWRFNSSSDSLRSSLSGDYLHQSTPIKNSRLSILFELKISLDSEGEFETFDLDTSSVLYLILNFLVIDPSKFLIKGSNYRMQGHFWSDIIQWLGGLTAR